MKNSFFLVIPEQQSNSDLLALYEKDAVDQWVSELPTANPSLATRLLYDFIEGFNKVKMSAQKRLDVLERLEPHFFTIEEYLRSRLIGSGFPKGQNDQKILDLTLAIEKHFTISYWMVARELTRKDVGWFQGKTVALSIQRTIKGLSAIVVTHYMMFLSVPDWVWIDLHSLYKLSVKVKKENTKVTDEFSANKLITAESCYKQVLLLSLTDPSGLMQKEIQQVYNFIGKITQFVKIETQPISGQSTQCIVLMDEDVQPYFDFQNTRPDSSAVYLNLFKLHKGLNQSEKFCSPEEARFSSMHILRNASEKLPASLFTYLVQCWRGVELQGSVFLSDRLDRYIAIGLDATHSLQSSLDMVSNSELEVLAESFSERALSCKFEKEGVVSIGSLVSYRQIKEQESKRSLGVVMKITIPKKDGSIVFELSTLAAQSYAVTYTGINSEPESEAYKALLYGTKNETEEKSFIIIESFRVKNDDLLRMFLNNENFPIVLGNRKNIGLGYWQFECRRLEEKQVQQAQQIQQKVTKKGYDFI